MEAAAESTPPDHPYLNSVISFFFVCLCFALFVCVLLCLFVCLFVCFCLFVCLFVLLFGCLVSCLLACLLNVPVDRDCHFT